MSVFIGLQGDWLASEWGSFAWPVPKTEAAPTRRGENAFKICRSGICATLPAPKQHIDRGRIVRHEKPVQADGGVNKQTLGNCRQDIGLSNILFTRRNVVYFTLGHKA